MLEAVPLPEFKDQEQNDITMAKILGARSDISTLQFARLQEQKRINQLMMYRFRIQ